MPLVIERFYSQTISEQVAFSFQAIPHRRGEHLIAAWQRVLDSPAFEGGQHHFRVGHASEVISKAGEFPAKVAEIVNFRIHRKDVAAAFRPHRLVSVAAEIHDAQSAMSQACSSVGGYPNPRGVGPAVCLGSIKPAEEHRRPILAFAESSA